MWSNKTPRSIWCCFFFFHAFNWTFSRIKRHSWCPYNCNQTRPSVKEGNFHLSHMGWTSKTCRKNDQLFAKALTHGSCPLRLRSYSLALDRTDLYTAIGFSTSHRLWREYIKWKKTTKKTKQRKNNNKKKQNTQIVSFSINFYRTRPLSSKVRFVCQAL